MDFEFNLDEISLGDSNGLEEFTFDQVGGSTANNVNQNEVLDVDRNNTAEDPLPGEDLLDDPPAENSNEGNSGEEAPEKLEIELIGNKIDEICVVNLEDTKKIDNKENGKLTPLNLEDNNTKEDNIEENGVKDIDIGCGIFCNGLRKLVLYLYKKVKKCCIKVKFIK